MDENEKTIKQAEELYEKFGKLSDDQLIYEIAKAISDAKKNGTYNRAEIIATLKEYESVLGEKRVENILDLLDRAEKL